MEIYLQWKEYEIRQVKGKGSKSPSGEVGVSREHGGVGVVP